MKIREDGKIQYNLIEKPFSMLGNFIHAKHIERFFNYYEIDNDKLTYGLGIEKYKNCMDSTINFVGFFCSENSPFNLLFVMIVFYIRIFFKWLFN